MSPVTLWYVSEILHIVLEKLQSESTPSSTPVFKGTVKVFNNIVYIYVGFMNGVSFSDAFAYFERNLSKVHKPKFNQMSTENSVGFPLQDQLTKSLGLCLHSLPLLL